MKKELVIKADSIEEAKEIATQKTGKEIDELQFTVVSDAKKGLFGKVKEQAEVIAVFDDAENKKAENCSEESDTGETNPISPMMEQKIERAQEYLKTVLDAFDCKEIEQKVTVNSHNVTIQLTGQKIGTIIGRRGETIDALQYLTSLAANRGGGEYLRVVIDCGNFREKRKETLKKLATRIGEKCLKENRSVTLEPMNPYERRLIHSTVSEIEGVSSKSVGEEPYRKVIIFSENAPKENRNNGRNKKNNHKYYDPDYMPPKGVSNQPSTYDFEKEFLKQERGDNKLYGKIDID